MVLNFNKLSEKLAVNCWDFTTDDPDINTNYNQFVKILLNAIEALTIEHKIISKVFLYKKQLWITTV